MMTLRGELGLITSQLGLLVVFLSILLQGRENISYAKLRAAVLGRCKEVDVRIFDIRE